MRALRVALRGQSRLGADQFGRMSAGTAEWCTNHAAGTRVRTLDDGGRDETVSSSGHGGRRGGRDRGRVRPGRPGPDERPPRRSDRAPPARQHHRHGRRRSAAARSPASSSRRSARPWRWRSAMAAGYFALDSLPTGEYVVQAHLNGFAGSLRERVQVGAAVAGGPPVPAAQARRSGRHRRSGDAGVGAADHGRRLRAARVDA